MANPRLTVDKIRFFLMDRCAQDNFLLDAMEFTDKDISNAFDLMVSKFNTSDPILRTQLFNQDTFIYEYEGCLGIAAILLRSKAINMARNRLEGASQIIDDKQNAGSYLKIAKDLDDEFTQRVRTMKMHVNINGPGAHHYLTGIMGA